MWRITLAFSILATSSSITSVVADTHYVSKTGTRIYPFDSWATAADTVARAVEAASEWDTILIAAGHYVSDTIRMKRGQVLIGAGPDSTILDTLPLAPASFPILAEDSCVVGDLTMRQLPSLEQRTIHPSAAPAAVGPGIRVPQDRATTIRSVRFDQINTAIHLSFQDASHTGRVCLVEGCEFLFNGVSTETAIAAWFPANVIVRNCLFRWDRFAVLGVIIADYSRIVVENCRFFGSDPYSPHGDDAAINTYRSDSIVIRNCLFHSNLQSPALQLNYDDGSSVPMKHGLIENNTFVGFFQHLRVDREGFVFRNNISTLDQSGSTTPAFYNGFATGEYNITWNNSPWDSGVVRGYDTIPNDIGANHDNRDVFPMFLDTIDFLLQAYSPAIDAGDPSVLDSDGSRSDIGYTGGPGGFSYTYLDLPPAIPRRFVGTPSAIQIALSWSKNHEADFYRYELYRDTLPILAADSELLLVSLPSDTVFVDSMIFPKARYHYRLRAVDAQANSSDLTDELQFVAAGVDGDDPPLPGAFILHPNYPNPFNSGTRVSIDAPASGRLDLAVYDVLGRKVAALHGGPVSTGRHDFHWQPTDAASGVYFIVARFNGMTRIGKLLLLK